MDWDRFPQKYKCPGAPWHCGWSAALMERCLRVKVTQVGMALTFKRTLTTERATKHSDLCAHTKDNPAPQEIWPAAKLLPCSHCCSQNAHPEKRPAHAADSERRCLINIFSVTSGHFWFQIIYSNSEFCLKPVYFTKALITAMFLCLVPQVPLFFLKMFCRHHVIRGSLLNNSCKHHMRNFKYPEIYQIITDYPTL